MKQEIDDNIDAVYAKVVIKERKIPALVDTGSTRNIISEKIAKGLNLEIEKVNPINMVVGNDQVLTMNETVDVSFNMGNGLKATERCYVSSSCPENLILGNEFLLNQGCVIDFRNMSLSAGKTKIQLNNNKNEILKPDYHKTIGMKPMFLIKEIKNQPRVKNRSGLRKNAFNLSLQPGRVRTMNDFLMWLSGKRKRGFRFTKRKKKKILFMEEKLNQRYKRSKIFINEHQKVDNFFSYA
jgi:hypothetical protein